jgi:DNA-binding MarR family transcriptional regulator
MTPPPAELARLLLQATRAIEAQMAERLAAAGLAMLRPGHFTVLRALEPGDAGMRASALARDAGVSRQAIGQAVADLERLGIVEQVPDPGDARAKLVRYTRFGRAGHRRAMAVFTDLEHELAARVGAARVSTLKADLARIAGRRP